MKTLLVSKDDKIIKGTVSLNGSKSESNRLLIIQALCKDSFKIYNLSKAEDTVILSNLLDKISASSHTETSSAQVTEIGSAQVLDVKDAGTAMRFLTGFLSIRQGKWLLTGSERMKKRPIAILVNALHNLGAEIEYSEEKNYPPLLIKGTILSSNEINIDANVSSQYITSLLLIAPCLAQGLILYLKRNIVSEPYIKMTLNIMKHFGIEIINNNRTIIIKNQNYIAKDYYVESDWSAASYWYEIAALADKADITIKGLKRQSIQGDKIIAEIFKNFGIETHFISDGIHLSKNNNLQKKQFNFDFTDYPDIAQTVIVCCAALNIKGHFKGLQNLKIKETDRTNALKKELAKFNVKFFRKSDSEWILENRQDNNKKFFTDLCISAYNDHRMAMAFSPLAINFGKLLIKNPESVKKSYPNFWKDLLSVGFKIQ
jgi:3-phosphoshikimate 1-carboxyvinyltransferase